MTPNSKKTPPPPKKKKTPTKSTDQSNIRHTNNSDSKTKVKSIKKIYDYSNL